VAKRGTTVICPAAPSSRSLFQSMMRFSAPWVVTIGPTAAMYSLNLTWSVIV